MEINFTDFISKLKAGDEVWVAKVEGRGATNSEAEKYVVEKVGRLYIQLENFTDKFFIEGKDAGRTKLEYGNAYQIFESQDEYNRFLNEKNKRQALFHILKNFDRSKIEKLPIKDVSELIAMLDDYTK